MSDTQARDLISIEEELKSSYLDYAMSVIVGRALPDVRDGLKPVHRRILFAMKNLGNDHERPHKKSARIVGDVIGKYHPHGDAAVYDAVVRMAQSFSMRHPLIDGQGNFGSIDGDAAAAMRYTEIRMSKIAGEMLTDIEKDTVDYVSNYDSTERLPSVLPTRIPNLLLNGSSGIAVGMATNIPPHNLSELIDGCLAYIADENIDVDGLMRHIRGPDFPTAAIIDGSGGIREAYSTGKGVIHVFAKARVETSRRTGRESIIVCEIPYQVNKSNLIRKIAELTRNRRIEGIANLRDESNKDGIRIVIEIRPDAVGRMVLRNLYNLTQLRISFGINMVALCDGQPKTLSLKEVLSSFVCHRKEVVIRRTNFELGKARERIRVLEALMVALFNVDRVVELIRGASTADEAQELLISTPWHLDDRVIRLSSTKTDAVQNGRLSPDNHYHLVRQQAREILNLRLQRLTTLEYERLIGEYRDLVAKISDLELILREENLLLGVISEELLLIRECYKDPRRTKIAEIGHQLLAERERDLHERVVVTLSQRGYIKYQPLAMYTAQHRGGKGKLAVSVKRREDFVRHLLVADLRELVLLFSNRGRMYHTKVHQLPEASRTSRGKPIANILPLEEGERITAILSIDDRRLESGYVFMATVRGLVKKVSLSKLRIPRSNGVVTISLGPEDELASVNFTGGDDDVMLFSSRGKVVCFPENQVRSTGRAAIGVRGIDLGVDDRVVSLAVPRRGGSILTVTQRGYGKRTSRDRYPIGSRANQGVASIRVGVRNGNVVGAVQVSDDDQIMIITDAGTLVRTRVSEIGVMGRNTQGVLIIRTTQQESVVGVQRIPGPDPLSR